MGYLDRNRCEMLLSGEAIDALLIVQPENFRYATGCHPGFVSLWRRAGTQMALVPASAQQPIAVVVPDALENAFRSAGIADVRTHPVWTDYHDFSSMPGMAAVDCIREGRSDSLVRRPATYDLALALGQLADILREMGLERARIGIELDFIPVSDLEAFRGALPQVEFVDSSSLLRSLQLIKTPKEIELLRLGAEITEAAIMRTAEAVKAGQCARELSMIFQAAVLEEARKRAIWQLESSWTAFCCGPDVRGIGNSTAPLRPGDVIKLDCGCSISGYTSDVARTYVLGRGSPQQKELHEIVVDAWNAGFEEFYPGNLLSNVFAKVQDCIHGHGYTSFQRGHFGHSIGASVWNEEWPYIARDTDISLEEGMVFAFEVPVYLEGLGAFTVEDHILVTASGASSMNLLTKDYREIG
jgi:Xaa-Pro dipeptidase